MSYSLPWVTSVCPALLVAAGVTSGETAKRIGIYHWGGGLTQSMSDGVERIARLGGRVARVAYSPRYYLDYGIGPACYPNYSLSALAQEPDVQRALDDHRIRALILTAYDGFTFGDCYTHRYLNPGFYTPDNIAAIKAEYSDFVLHLFRRYAGLGRRFILSNWEGDNAVYCGSAYRYLVDPEFRTSCNANYPAYYSGNAGPKESLEGMKLWFRTRQEGILAGIAQAGALGLTGIEVVQAPEISAVRMLEENGIPDVLRHVLGWLKPDYVSYSSYESLNRENPGQALIADIETIRAVTGSRAVIIGEAGYPRSIWGEGAVRGVESVIRAAFDSGVEYFIYWNLNDQSSAANFGVFDTDDRLTPTGQLLERMLRKGVPE
jgi:hypothetical protein